jgi:Mn2+/Fe2+ NRAMP family transporter
MWAIGLFAAGQAATMVCTYAGQIIMGGCLQIQLSPWVRVAITRVFALGPALAVAISTYGHQKLFNQINEYLNVLQSVQLPFAMLPVLHFAAQSSMKQFRSGAGPQLPQLPQRPHSPPLLACALLTVVCALCVVQARASPSSPPSSRSA